MTLRFEPATIVDMADVAGRTSHLAWAIAREQWRGGAAYAMRDGDELVAVAGYYPMAEGVAECWLSVTPTARRHVFGMLNTFKLTAVDAGYREIVAICRSPAGVMIARRAGFTFRENCELGEIWTWMHCSAAARKSS